MCAPVLDLRVLHAIKLGLAATRPCRQRRWTWRCTKKFYSAWHVPDNPALSCCNNVDCYPTDIDDIDGDIYAKRRVDAKYILIPPQNVERSGDNPIGKTVYARPGPVSRTRPLRSIASPWEALREVRVGQGRTPVRQNSCVLCAQPIGMVAICGTSGRGSVYCGVVCHAH